MPATPVRFLRAAVPAAVLALLAACGGSDDPATPASSTAAVAEAHDDSATVRWNVASSVDVAANDTVRNGTASVAVLTAPEHGTTSIEGTSVRYTPAAGFFGDDTLTYALTVGGQTSQATLQLHVAAEMTISGTVHDDALPGASVVVNVGGVDLPPVTADADGRYSVTVSTTSPADFITLTATGAGAQSGVVLKSLVGDAAATAAVAAEDGSVSAAALPAANVTNVSTALAVLTEQALGKAPASSADVVAAQGKFTADATLQMATAIKMVADQGVALPAGVGDTLALVAAPSTYTAFVADQVTHNGDAFAQTQASVLADPVLATAPPVPAAGAADVNILLTLGQGASATAATRLTLRADGTATIAGDSVSTGAWTTNGGEIDIAFDTPVMYDTWASDATGTQYAATERDTGLRLRQLGGTPGVGPAVVSTTSTLTWTEGPSTGQSFAGSADWQSETMVGATPAITAADVAPNTEWAGIIIPSFSPATADFVNQDVMKFVDATTVLFERSQVTGTWSLADGKLTVSTRAGTQRYTRLFTGPRGEERWLAEGMVAGAPAWTYDAAVVKVTPGLSFTAATAAHDWLSYINVGLAGADEFHVVLAAGGTGYTATMLNGQAGTALPATGEWQVNVDGTETFWRASCAAGPLVCGTSRTWQLVATSGANAYVMEHLAISNGYDQWRLNVYVRQD